MIERKDSYKVVVHYVAHEATAHGRTYNCDIRKNKRFSVNDVTTHP